MNEENKEYEFVELWRVQHPSDRGSMEKRGLIPDICDEFDGRPIRETGPPPAHPNCLCDTVVVIREKGSGIGDRRQ